MWSSGNDQVCLLLRTDALVEAMCSSGREANASRCLTSKLQGKRNPEPSTGSRWNFSLSEVIAVDDGLPLVETLLKLPTLNLRRGKRRVRAGWLGVEDLEIVRAKGEGMGMLLELLRLSVIRVSDALP